MLRRRGKLLKDYKQPFKHDYLAQINTITTTFLYSLKKKLSILQTRISINLNGGKVFFCLKYIKNKAFQLVLHETKWILGLQAGDASFRSVLNLAFRIIQVRLAASEELQNRFKRLRVPNFYFLENQTQLKFCPFVLLRERKFKQPAEEINKVQ